MKDNNWHQVLVFTRTKHGANRLTQQLESAGIRAAAIHGNKSQSARVRALTDFKENRITALVATEVAARTYADESPAPCAINARSDPSSTRSFTPSAIAAVTGTSPRTAA